ncbi:MAG TPA: GSCFA domain-containing protein [Chitinispirillaceae bacterium]|nr:GSCFA domain-containing protein [Chitinispirillaceae bacterium]
MTTLFRIPVPIPALPVPITHQNTILMLGSCFSENIGNALQLLRFKVCSNPTGILYNPFSIASALDRIISGTPYTRDDLFQHQGYWHSFDHHSRFSAPSSQQALDAINASLLEAHRQIQHTDICILTAGTSYTFTEITSGRIVANCHKMPQQHFSRRCVTSQETYLELKNLFIRVIQQFPAMRFILTISPVRHYPTDPRANQLSKSNLISALYQLENEFQNVYYFPSFEIMMDELRDYRFYTADMAHPSETAIQYIRERFLECCVAERSRKFIEQYTVINQSRNHLLSPTASAESQKQFASSLLQKITRISKEFPDIDISDDEHYFRKLSTDAGTCLS